ncbi:predicted protein [Postia placenta Mad-698-R]|uniref:DUF6535 domain-containing protein n=1 Tax=Postia placenta MAD-698-R-SB12 TaxID=670580 RepID=A0A1X6ML51_9APHY|nr:hypothetical protein POSPLADRAFT_1050420 [Postia placenta MAD-698-R-SB12]EED84592.1 predicted protein [Postia placenta Mad-698-R]OSX57038.1 hypothetical protein POSPLADRAFT_1050420 [Postia placenta MAD-698-R-SB12]
MRGTIDVDSRMAYELRLRDVATSREEADGSYRSLDDTHRLVEEVPRGSTDEPPRIWTSSPSQMLHADEHKRYGRTREESNATPLPQTSPKGTRQRMNSEGLSSEPPIWAACAEIVWARESEMVEKWNAEIDALLVFAGLFSAALTAFNVQYLISQPQSPPSNPTPQITIQIPAQLISLITDAGSRNNSFADPISIVLASSNNSSSNNSALTTSSIAVNTLWIAALVFSLAAASIAISVKQWLNQFTARVTSMPRQNVVVWYSRRRGFVKWKVEAIINLLPILLQIALVLFLIGLMELIWTINMVIFYTAIPFVAPLLLFSLCTSVFPAISADCPYRSPQAWCIAVCVQWIKSGLGIGRRSVDWIESERDFVTSQDHRFADPMLLVEADAAVMDEVFLKTVIQPYMATCSLDDATEILFGIFQNRIHGISDSRLAWNVDRNALTTIARMTFDLLYRFVNNQSSPSSDAPPQKAPINIPPKLVTVLQKLIVAMHADPRASVFLRLLRFLTRDDHRLSVDVFNRLVDVVLEDARGYLEQGSRVHDVYDSLFNLLENKKDILSGRARSRLMHIAFDKSDWLAILISESDRPGTASSSILLHANQREPAAEEAGSPNGDISPLVILEDCLTIAERDSVGAQLRGFSAWKNLIRLVRQGGTVTYDTFIQHAEDIFLTRGDAYNLWLVL